MNTFLQCDWNDILEGKSAVQQFDIFMTKFNEAKNKYIPHMISQAIKKAKKHNYIPMDAKPIQKIKKKHRCWTRYRETGDKKSIRNTPKQEIKLKAQSGKQKLIWRKKLQKMLRATPILFGNMLTPREKLTLVYQN
jgi:hypothetical protein